MKIYNIIIPIIMVLLISCKNKNDKLKIFGRKTINKVGDTIYHKINDFNFINQDGRTVSNHTFDGGIYIADFFFTTCPTICPIMKSQMIRVYQKYQSNEKVKLLSHTIDPKHDTVEVLKDFSDRLGVDSNKWHFVTGNIEDIYKIGQTSYLVSASEDPSAPGGFIHSGYFILIDKEKRIRGYYDGTVENSVDLLIKDIETLLQEYEN